MKVALALGGGAALGWAHLGVLEVLAQDGIEVAAVAGTSMGAIVAAALATGKLGALEEIARGAHVGRVLGYLDPMLGRGGMLGGRRVARELARHLGGGAIEDLPLAVSLVAADLLSGEEVRLTRGPIVPAVQASIAIPALFRPVRVGGRLLIDGGMVANLPIAAARALAPGLPVIVVDVIGDYPGHVGAALPGGLGSRPSAFRVGRSAFLMLLANQGRQAIALERPEIVIRPRVGHIGTGAFSRAAALIALGREAAEDARPVLSVLKD